MCSGKGKSGVCEVCGGKSGVESALGEDDQLEFGWM